MGTFSLTSHKWFGIGDIIKSTTIQAVLGIFDRTRVNGFQIFPSVFNDAHFILGRGCEAGTGHGKLEDKNGEKDNSISTLQKALNAVKKEESAIEALQQELNRKNVEITEKSAKIEFVQVFVVQAITRAALPTPLTFYERKMSGAHSLLFCILTYYFPLGL